jgi:O-antigen ligase
MTIPSRLFDMFIIPGLLGLVALIFLKPQEFSDALRSLPLLYIFFGLSVVGYLVDFIAGRNKPQGTPQLAWVVAFALWCLITVGIKAPQAFGGALAPVAILTVVFILMAHGVQSLRAFELLAALILASTLFISVAGVQQGSSPRQCVAFPAESDTRTDNGESDGRPCETTTDCTDNRPLEDVDYRCERVGMLGTSTVGGRVRYVGNLHDPNETALAVALGIPIAFAFFQRRKSVSRALMLAVTVFMAGLCIVFTKSRAGQLVFLTVVGAYLLRKYRWRGGLVAALVAVPVLLWGGRAGEEAASSSRERLECLHEGIQMWLGNPVLGVGYGQFTDHHFMTAHNSYVLAPAELGFGGLLVWSAVLFISMRIPLTVLQNPPVTEDADALSAWAMGLMSAMSGILVGVFFLSFNYHHVLWIFLGLTGALYSVVKRVAPDWNLHLGLRDLWALVGVDTALLTGFVLYTRLFPP